MNESELQKKILKHIPKDIIDVHVHLGLDTHHEVLSDERKKSAMSASEAYSLTLNQHNAAIEQILPGVKYRSFTFPFPFKETFVNEANEYIMEHEYPIILGTPEHSNTVITQLSDSKSIGLKTYYDFVDKPYYDISISDFTPEAYLKTIDELRKIWILHVPGNSLADSSNLKEVDMFTTKYPNISIVLAHMGRCNSREDFEQTVNLINSHQNLYLDTSVCTNQGVYEAAFEKLNGNRILHGSDAPYAFTKGKIFDIPGPMGKAFITEDVFDWTLPHLRNWYLKHKPFLTHVLYHQLEAMIDAKHTTHFKESFFEDIFYKNPLLVLERIRK